MGEKSAQKKQYIVNQARQVFMEKGFKNVSMKDIVDVCDISRGGLYLYFSGTEELFLEVLKADDAAGDNIFAEQLAKGETVADILALFLKEEKKELLRKKNSLTVAIYEYFLGRKPEKNNMLRKQFDDGVAVLRQLIEAGMTSGEFYCEDPKGAATNIMYVLEGMKIDAHTMGLTEEMVDAQLLYLLQGLLTEQ